MDGALVVITLVSLGTTGAVLLYAARLIRDERTRSNARVTALAEEIGHDPAGAGRARPIAYAPPAGTSRSAGAQRELFRRNTPMPVARTRSARHRTPSASAGRDRCGRCRAPSGTVPATSDDGRSQGDGAGRAALFQSASTESPSNRWLVPIIGAVIVVLALATIYFVSGQPEAAAGPAALRLGR